jgi:hypothetical protein
MLHRGPPAEAISLINSAGCCKKINLGDKPPPRLREQNRYGRAHPELRPQLHPQLPKTAEMLGSTTIPAADARPDTIWLDCGRCRPELRPQLVESRTNAGKSSGRTRPQLRTQLFQRPVSCVRTGCVSIRHTRPQHVRNSNLSCGRVSVAEVGPPLHDRPPLLH